MAEQLNLTEKYQVLPSMPPEQFEALKADIAERGVLTPIDVDEDGHILDGHHRYRACVELGVSDFPTIVRPGLSENERRVFARKSNMLRRHLTRAQRRELIAAQLKDTPEWANNRIGQELGVTGKTVAKVRAELEATSEIPKLDKFVGADGKVRRQRRPPAITATNLDELERLLKKLAEGESTPEDLEGFLSADTALVIYTSDYDPWSDLTDEAKRGWYIFNHFLLTRCRFKAEGAGHHVEWLLRKDFKTPGEWLGEEGTRWRKSIGMREPSKRLKRSWEEYLTEHADLSLAELEAARPGDLREKAEAVA